MTEVEEHGVAMSLEELVVELFHVESCQAHISIGRVFGVAGGVIYLAYDFQAVLLAPPLQGVGRVVDIGSAKQRQVRLFLIVAPMVQLVLNPVGVYVPEHPLRSHLKETAAKPALHVRTLCILCINELRVLTGRLALLGRMSGAGPAVAVRLHLKAVA